MTCELRISLKVSNNRLKRAREDLGLSSREAAKRIGMSYQELLKYEAMTKDPRSSRNGILPSARRICAFYGATPDYFWPEALLAVKMLKAEREIAADDVHLVPSGSLLELSSETASAEDRLEAHEKRAWLLRRMEDLSPQEAQILRMRFGLDGEEHSLEAIGSMQGKSQRSILKTQQRALRKIRRLAEIDAKIAKAKRLGILHCPKCGISGACSKCDAPATTIDLEKIDAAD
jgi:DNA-directed RNA polymerase sigma subunit (sigma70/sigma32)